MNKNTKEIVLYGIVGVVGVVIDTLTFWLLLQTALPLIVVQWFAAFAGATHNHLWHHFKVFDHDQGLRKTYFLGMSLAIVLVLASGPFIAILNRFIGLLWLSKAITISVTAVVSFIVKKFFIFRRKKSVIEKVEDVVTVLRK